MALLDPSRRDLYVACTGDSRAVAGIWEENEDGTGAWRVEVLTEDQTGRNVNEANRYAGPCLHSFTILTSTSPAYVRNTP
jgi:serine/threonine protein phosphatase PrpC